MKNNSGQALVEYILIIAIVSTLVIGLVTYFDGYLKDVLTKVSCSLTDKNYEEGENPGDGACVESNDIFAE